MSTTAFKTRCDRLFGYGWKTRLAAGIQRDYATVKRWAAGTVEVPDYVETTLELLEALPEERWPKRWQRPAHGNSRTAAA